MRKQGKALIDGRAILLIGLLLVASCAFPGSVRHTVKIGLVAPFEGRYRYVGYDVIYAVRLALQEANERGGVSGYGVELVAYDDGGDPALAVDQARKLDVDPRVMAAVGHFRQETTAASLRAYADAGMPLVTPAVLDSDLVQPGRPVYVLGPKPAALAAVLLDRASSMGGPGEMVLISDGGALGDALQDAAEEHGLDLVSTSSDSASWRQDVVAQDPRLLFVLLDPVPAGEVVRTLRKVGWDGDVLGGPSLAAADFAAVAGAAAEGAVFITPWPFPTDLQAGETFADAYRAVSNGLEPGPYALPAYEASWLLLRALENAGREGELTREAVRAALPGVHREGWLGLLSFDPKAKAEWPLTWYWYRIGPDGAPHRLPWESE